MPCVLAVTAVMAGCLFVLYQAILSDWNNDDSRTRLTVAAVGTETDTLLQVGFAALETMDSSRLSLELVKMDQQQAHDALVAGTISAYVVFPDGFMEQAMHGNITPLRFVSSSGSHDIFTLLRDELTKSIADILVASEQGAFGLGKALRDLGYSEIASQQMDAISVAYASLLLNREQIYIVQELGAADSMDMTHYMAGGILTLLLFLMALPFAYVLIRDDLSVNRQLSCCGVGSIKQSICEFLALFLFLGLLYLAFGFLLTSNLGDAFVSVIPVAFSVAAIGYLLYSLCKELISGTLLYLIAAICICFLSGCMYPIHFFPTSIQRVGEYLPAFAVRRQLSGLLTGADTGDAQLQLVFTGILCLGAACLRNYIRLRTSRREKR